MNIVPISIHSTPRSHKEIAENYDGAFLGMTGSNLEYLVKVEMPYGDTTNEHAKFLMAQRIKMAAEASRKGQPIGVDQPINVTRSEMVKIEISMDHGGRRFRIPLTLNADNSYTDAVSGRRHRDLRAATQHVMETFELQQGIAVNSKLGQIAARAAQVARERTMDPTIGQLRR